MAVRSDHVAAKYRNRMHPGPGMGRAAPTPRTGAPAWGPKVLISKKIPTQVISKINLRKQKTY